MDSETSQLATLLVAISSTLVAVAAVVIAYRVLLQTAMPSVAVRAEVDRDRPTVLNLVVENMGRAPALNVSFTPNVELVQVFGMPSLGDPTEVRSLQTSVFTTGVPVLHPGERRITTWGQFGGLTKHYAECSVISVAATFEYDRPLFRRGALTQRSEIHLQSFTMEDISDSPLLKVAKSLEKIARNE